MCGFFFFFLDESRDMAIEPKPPAKDTDWNIEVGKSLQCTAQAKPPPTIAWKCDRGAKTTKGMLIFIFNYLSIDNSSMA